GGTVAIATTQAFTHSPDSTMHRFMPSLAVDRAGNMAIGYSTSNSSTKPAIKYAGRQAGDPLSSLPQTEQLEMQGTGTQVGSSRWGDYSAMTPDPDGCTFWYTNEYYAADGLDSLTRIASFKFPSCSTVGSGTVQGTVTALVGGAAIPGATVALGERTTTTNGAGFYQFTGIPAGTYPTLAASAPGFNTGTVASVVVTDGGTTVQNFALSTAPTSACLTDTTQPDFQTGVPDGVDLTASPGNVVLSTTGALDQANISIGGFGFGISTTTWGGQTFTAGVSGQLTKADINLFCTGCTGPTPDLTLALRAGSGGIPTGGDIATATITGFSSGVATYYTGVFSTHPALVAGTQYALVIRPNAAPSAGTYAVTRSGSAATGSDVYGGGALAISSTSGATWAIPTGGGISTDAAFRTFVFDGTGTQVSGLKDANPAAGAFPFWTTITWNASIPAGTDVKIQAAASNNSEGPFAFVGP